MNLTTIKANAPRLVYPDVVVATFQPTRERLSKSEDFVIFLPTFVTRLLEFLREINMFETTLRGNLTFIQVNEIRLPKKILLSLTEYLLGSVCEPIPSRVFESCLLLSISRAAVHHAAAPILRTRALLLHTAVRVTRRQPQHIQVQRMQAPEYRAAFTQGIETSNTQRQQTQ